MDRGSHNQDSHTGQYLRGYLADMDLEGPHGDREIAPAAADD